MGNRKKRRTLAPKWQYVGLGVLAVATAAAVASAVIPKAEPVDHAGLMEKAEQHSIQVRSDIDAANAAYAASLITTIQRPTDRPLRYIVPGDSLAGGYYSSSEAKSFRSLVSASLATHGPVEEVKASQAGANLSTVGGLVGIPEDLDLAVIELGTNDTAGKTEIGAFTQQYETLLATIKKGSPNVALVCVGPWGAPGAGTDPYDEAVEKSCKKQGGQFVNVSAVMGKGENRTKKGAPSWLGPADDFHPNDAGHQKIADLILERIKVV